MKRIAFCTTVKGRVGHLRQTLPRNLADNASYENAVFVVLDYGDEEGLTQYLWEHQGANIASGRLVVYRYDNGGAPFHVAHAKNMAARCGILEGAEILVTLDGDNFTGQGFAQFVDDQFREPGLHPGIFLCPNYQLIKSLPHGSLRPPRGYAGRLAVWTQTFIKVGGYDELYDTWRGEDTDMNFRLQRMGYTMRYIDNKYLNAINHNAQVRFKEYPHARKYENRSEIDLIRSRTQTVVNHGRFGMGRVSRNYGRATMLGPVPTRIFGIGLHKTATTSLHHALQALGFDSFHWGQGEAPLIWYEMNSLGKSPTLERWYGLSDLPIPLLYQKLDAAYPGSKFILTVRDEASWLESVRKLWDYKFNPTRRIWDIHPFTNVIHTALYGRADFDAETFLARYRQHNAEVLEYFRGRPDDLLVTEAGVWEPLCAFLGCPVPGAQYPTSNKTGEIGATFPVTF